MGINCVGFPTVIDESNTTGDEQDKLLVADAVIPTSGIILFLKTIELLFASYSIIGTLSV
jgi:hypothetical protein